MDLWGDKQIFLLGSLLGLFGVGIPSGEMIQSLIDNFGSPPLMQRFMFYINESLLNQRGRHIEIRVGLSLWRKPSSKSSPKLQERRVSTTSKPYRFSQLRKQCG
jgi:hypothetical protein